MASPLYLYNADTAGYALDATGHGSNFTQLYAAGQTDIFSGALPRDNADTIYLFGDDAHTFMRSTDGGLTWSIITTAPWTSGGWITDMVAHASGDIHLFQTTSASSYAGLQGIWRSTDAGASWSHILTLPNVNQNQRGGGIAAGASKLWLAESNTPLVSGSLPHNLATYDIKTCNWDGSGVAFVASINFDRASGVTAGQRAKMRAIDDTFCLAMDRLEQGRLSQVTIYRITSTGTVTTITPPGIQAWDIAIFGSTTFVAAGPAAGSTAPYDVLVARTTDAGATWATVQTIPGLEGFANRGSDDYMLVDAARPGGAGSATDGYMYGYANGNAQPWLWRTVDAGQTWTSLRNAAALVDGSGNYLEFGSGGVLVPPIIAPRVAIPSRLATIVG